MKKRDLWIGVGLIFIGVGFLLAALRLDTPLGSLFCGFSGGLIAPGVVQIIKYVKWTSPKSGPAYREKLEQERIDLKDERKSMLRDKSGRYAYVLGLLLVVAAQVSFVILEMLGIISRESTILLVPFLTGYLVVEYLAGIAFYRWLEKKY